MVSSVSSTLQAPEIEDQAATGVSAVQGHANAKEHPCRPATDQSYYSPVYYMLPQMNPWLSFQSTESPVECEL